MSRPSLIIISGPPGAGKTTLALPLARRLGFPLLQKDAIKERLADAFGPSEIEHSRRIGLGSILVLYDIAREMLSNGQSLVIESTFYRGTAEADLAPLVAISDAVIVHVSADEEVLATRYERRARSPERHPVHAGVGVNELRQNVASGVTQPPDLGVPNLAIDTTTSFPDPEDVASQLIAMLEPRTPVAKTARPNPDTM